MGKTVEKLTQAVGNQLKSKFAKFSTIETARVD